VTNLRTLLSLALGALLAAPLAAGAAVTATTVSQPATDPSVLVFVEPAGVPLTVSGTSNGGTGRLDLRCEGAATPVVDANVRPAATGVWTTTLSVATVSRLSARTCLLHAVPHGNAGTNRVAFAGKRVMFQRSRVTAVVGGPNNGVPYDFRYWAPQLLGRSIWQSVSNCGLAGAATIAPTTFHVSGSAFPCAGFVAPTTSGRAGVLVDHVNAYMPSAAATLFNGSANALGLLASQTSISTDPSTGNVLIRETENLLRCSPDAAALPATALTCSSFVSAGVKLDRLIIQQGDGRQALVTDTWSSTDGRHHEVDAFYEDRLGGTAPVVSFPWAGGFTSYPPGFTQSPPPTAPFSFFTRSSPSAADGDQDNPQGAITLQDRPTSLRFRTSSAIWTQYVRTLTPETPTHVSFGFSWATSQAELTTLIGQAERSLGPAHCLVPNLVGRTLTDSKRLLLAGHCKVGKIKYATSKVRRKNRVIRQGHRPATTLRGGSGVTLLVSSRLIGKA
jgi:PASTA domain-containing protein